MSSLKTYAMSLHYKTINNIGNYIGPQYIWILIETPVICCIERSTECQWFVSTIATWQLQYNLLTLNNFIAIYRVTINFLICCVVRIRTSKLTKEMSSFMILYKCLIIKVYFSSFSFLLPRNPNFLSTPSPKKIKRREKKNKNTKS